MTDFETQVREKQKEYRADSYAMSYGEIINLYSSGEIIISPDFQRFYRWNLNQKSRFIESLILDLPTPSIFVYQRMDGKWELVDGLQRLSTIFEFAGVLKDSDGKLAEPSILAATDKLPLLKGLRWTGVDENQTLPDSLKLEIKRRKVTVQIIQSVSDPSAKYEVLVFPRKNGHEISCGFRQLFKLYRRHEANA